MEEIIELLQIRLNSQKLITELRSRARQMSLFWHTHTRTLQIVRRTHQYRQFIVDWVTSYNVPMIPIKYIWKDISLNISIKCISEKVFPKSSVIISIHILKPERGTLDQRKKLLLTLDNSNSKGGQNNYQDKKTKVVRGKQELGLSNMNFYCFCSEGPVKCLNKGFYGVRLLECLGRR